MRTWLRLNALSLVVFAAFLVFLTLQTVFGWQTRNDELMEAGRAADTYLGYLGTGHFVEATFENWESEFLQMGSYVLLAAFLVQRGSAESRPLDEEREPSAPGGWTRKLYENSLSIALLGMFVLSFLLHLLGGTAEYNEQQSLNGEPSISAARFLGTSEFWFQSMQNWQSEFLAVGALIVLSIFLRQRGSSQSKKVTEPDAKTGS